MKTTKGVLTMAAILTALFCWAIPLQANDGPKQLKIKGLYLGMDLKAARKVCEKFIEDPMFITETGADSFGIFSQFGLIGIISCDQDNKVAMIAMERPFVDKLFDSAAMPAEEFARQFISAYKIPSMEPFRDQTAAGWRFISPHGYKVEIHSNGDLLIQKIAKRGSLKFD